MDPRRIPTHEEDVRVEIIIGTLLRAGVIIAATVVACGAVLFLAKHAGMQTSFRVFQSEPAELRSVMGTLRGTLAGHSVAIMQLGLVLLLATPVARVAFSLAVFVRQRDWLYVTTTAIVLALLVLSLMSGR